MQERLRDDWGCDGAAMGLFFSFKGRAGRTQYWLGNLLLLVLMLAALIGWVAALKLPDAAFASQEALLTAVMAQPDMLVAIAAILLAVLVCAAAIIVKRYHDRGKSGWWAFLFLVPVVGPAWQFIECGFLPGQKGFNRFDADEHSSSDVAATGVSAGSSLPAGPPAHRLERAIAVSAAKQAHNARLGRRSYQ